MPTHDTHPGERSRIDGTLHRVLPATITLRALDPAVDGSRADDNGLLRLHISASSEIPYLRQNWWDDPWIEVLGHDPSECDLSRFDSGAGVVLANHDRYLAVGNTPLAAIGAVDGAKLAARRLELDITISRREALADLRQDIGDGLVRNVSIAYIINERVLVRQGKDGEADEYRVTNWTPFEVSLVDIPADATVGLGRSVDGADQTQNAAPQYRVVALSPAVGTTTTATGERTMPDPVTPAADPQTAQQTAARSAADPLAAERERVREITAMARQFGAADLADAAVDNGASVDAFRAQLLGRLKDNGTLRAAESPEIGMGENDVQSYSFLRALLAASDPVNAHKLAPFELECSRAAQDKRGESRGKDRDAAITIPVDVLSRGINLGAGASASAARMLVQRAQRGASEAQLMMRDLVAGTATAGGNLVATELLGSSFIDLLRNALVLDKLGITWLRDLNGNVAIPSQTGGASYYWVAESGSPTESQATFGQVTLTPKTVGAFTDYSRRLLLQSSIDVEAFARADLAATLAQALMVAAINGAGASNEPLGILNTSGIGSVAIGTNGGAPTYDMAVDLETAVANANADAGNLAYLTNSRVRGKLRKTQEFASTNGKPVWTSGRERGVGEVLGYDAWVTNAVPNTLTKGTSTGVCSAGVFGNWSDLLIGMWGGLDILLDPYTGSTSGTRRVVALQDVDIAVRRVASFAAVKDILTI